MSDLCASEHVSLPAIGQSQFMSCTVCLLLVIRMHPSNWSGVCVAVHMDIGYAR